MIIKINRKEALGFFNWRTRRKIKKFERKTAKNPELKKEWDKMIDDIDKALANDFDIAFDIDKEGNGDIKHVSIGSE